MRYTKKLHAYRLSRMLEHPEPCMCCPASKGFDETESAIAMWDNKYEICTICWEFLGEEENILYCPCHVYNIAEVINLTLKKLKEFYKK